MSDKIQPANVLQKITQYTIASLPAAVDLQLDKGDSSGPDYPATIFEDCFCENSVGRYPNPRPLEAEIAKFYSVTPDRVIVTAGADDALERVCKSILGPGDEMLQASPTFEMIERYVILAGAKVKKIPWPKDRYPLEEIIQAKTRNTKILAVVSPNNPTGQTITKEMLLKLSEAFADALVLLDLAYVEFAHEDPTAEALNLPNVVITRSFSKAWGLAGARAGFAIGPKSLIAWMRRAGVPFGVSGPALEMAQQVFLNGREEMKAFASLIISQREFCASLLKSLGVEVLESQANFVCAKFRNAKFVWQSLSGLGIAVRYFPHIPELNDTLRITLPGTKEEFKRLIEGFKTILDPDAIVFDIDGVIADSSQSYRQTVIETSRHYGVTVTPEMITKAKSEGSANDDWELTHRFVSVFKQNVSLQEVTSLFEELYQGTSEKGGLCRQEKLLGNFESLEQLSKKTKLGVLTGRPKQDVERFLDYVGIRKYFSTIVSREDAPLKPDPTGMLKVMELLGCTRGWMLGDTPDDMRAARGATFKSDEITVLPVGVLAPWDNAQVMTEKLHAAGAGVVLNGIEELYSILLQ